MLLHALLLAFGLTLVETAIWARWTYNLKCHDCLSINNYNCPNVRVCNYEVRRCMTISIRLNLRELLIYKNCTNNCTFLYPSQVPPEAPRVVKTNNFYWVRCCNSMVCNDGGPSLERDIIPDKIIEEEIEGTVPLGESTFLLSFASVLVSYTLT
uniref:Glycosylphosphatidylinositol anchored molecule like n=1 Tax=Rhinolophus ferrumequinum TaxID=59479 RepID=A0A671FIW7_RHIFE